MASMPRSTIARSRAVSLYLSGEYLHARLDDDLPVGGDLLPTRGKHAVSSPTVQFGAGGTYDDGRFFGSIASKYLGRQYASFMNDESIKGYATLDLSIGVHLADWLDGKRTDLRVNAINVTDPHVLAGVQAVTPNAQDTDRPQRHRDRRSGARLLYRQRRRGDGDPLARVLRR